MTFADTSKCMHEPRMKKDACAPARTRPRTLGEPTWPSAHNISHGHSHSQKKRPRGRNSGNYWQYSGRGRDAPSTSSCGASGRKPRPWQRWPACQSTAGFHSSPRCGLAGARALSLPNRPVPPLLTCQSPLPPGTGQSRGCWRERQKPCRLGPPHRRSCPVQ